VVGKPQGCGFYQNKGSCGAELSIGLIPLIMVTKDFIINKDWNQGLYHV